MGTITLNEHVGASVEKILDLDGTVALNLISTVMTLDPNNSGATSSSKSCVFSDVSPWRMVTCTAAR